MCELDEAGRLLTDSSSQPKGRVHVSAPASVAREILAPALPGFLARYPGISLRVLATDRIVDLPERGLDCAVRASEPTDDGRTVKSLVRMPQFFAASPCLLARHGMPRTLADIAALPFINYNGKRDESRLQVQAIAGNETHQFDVDAPISVDDGAAYVALACAGLGVVQSPLCDLRHHLVSGRLRLLLPECRGPALTFHMVYAEGKQFLPRVRAFVDWVHELLMHEQHHQPQA
ncbi:LysR substrate-binding domain-containing protein [Roseateles sp.]|uniref:LysR substrate-binding domain-containing protein n=3 Tax=Pseudomonadota TaxID=1224 RepID=UPI0026894F2A